MDSLINIFVLFMLTIALAFFYYSVITIVMYDFLQKVKKIITSDWQIFFLGFFAYVISSFKLYLPLVYSSELVTIFVFLPSLAFFNSTKKKTIIKSSIKILFFILFIKMCLTTNHEINNESSLIYTPLKSLIYASFYCECLKVFAILMEYFKEDSI